MQASARGTATAPSPATTAAQPSAKRPKRADSTPKAKKRATGKSLAGKSSTAASGNGDTSDLV